VAAAMVVFGRDHVRLFGPGHGFAGLRPAVEAGRADRLGRGRDGLHGRIVHRHLADLIHDQPHVGGGQAVVRDHLGNAPPERGKSFQFLGSPGHADEDHGRAGHVADVADGLDQGLFFGHIVDLIENERPVGAHEFTHDLVEEVRGPLFRHEPQFDSGFFEKPPHAHGLLHADEGRLGRLGILPPEVRFGLP